MSDRDERLKRNAVALADEVRRVIFDLCPDATNVTVRTVNAKHDLFEILGYRGERPNGAVIYRDRIIVQR